MRKTFYHSCPLCGANLDPGERCTCTLERGDAAWMTKRPPDKAVPDPTEYINKILERLKSRKGA